MFLYNPGAYSNPYFAIARKAGFLITFLAADTIPCPY